MRNLETAKRGRNIIHSNLAFLGDSKKTHIPPEFLGECLHSKIVEWNLPETLLCHYFTELLSLRTWCRHGF